MTTIMPNQAISPAERDSIQAEQVKAYFKDAGDLNLAGAGVFSLLVYVVHDETPWWTWAPALAVLCLVTLLRAALIRQYRQAPGSRNSTRWANSQAATGGMAGVCWGLSNAAMLAYLPTTLQLFVLTVSTVVAATSTSEGFSLPQPPRLFIIASLGPSAVYLLAAGDRLHIVLALMLLLFVPVTSGLITKKNTVFVEAQHLRFQNEALAAELSEQHEKIQLVSASKSRFLAAASHDLRQPLAALMIFLELLEREQQLSNGGKEILRGAQQATASLRGLLDALLDISKLDVHAIKPNMRAFNIQDLLNGLEQEFLPVAKRKGIRLCFVRCSAAVSSDPDLLGQILRNLISNAVRYTESGRVLVGCRHRRGMLDVEVHDTGIGIAESQFTKIFEEFYQIGNQARDRQQGLGLGLSIVDRAAKLIGHSVTVRSRLQKGSCFTVSVPIARDGVREQQSGVKQQDGAKDLAGRLIAVIENEGAIRAGMLRLLHAWGCRVIVAESAPAMVEQLAAQPEHIDMIISDFGLGGDQNGINAIASIRDHCGASLPALLFTGDISKEAYHAAQTAGLPMVYKPVKPEALRAAILAAI